MHSRNKPKPTAAQAKHIERVAQLGCVVCREPGPSEAHEPEQGLWWLTIPLCPECHRGKDGWHGTRLRWALRKMDELKAINETLARLAG